MTFGSHDVETGAAVPLLYASCLGDVPFRLCGLDWSNPILGAMA